MNNEIREKFLPVGTVVMLKEAEKRVMIIGFCIVPTEEPDKVYDYMGCLYPEGVMDPKQNLLFNHDQIAKIYHIGLEDDEEKEFKAKLKNYLETEKNSNNADVFTEVQ